MDLSHGRADTRLAPFPETRAAVDRRNASGSTHNNGITVWGNQSGNPIDAATFALHWTKREVAYGTQLQDLWAAFLVPEPALEASAGKMALLDGIARNEALKQNPTLLKWVTAKRAEFAEQVQQGLRGLAQDFTFMRSNFALDPLQGPDRVRSLQRNLRLVTGQAKRGELLQSLMKLDRAARLTQAQTRELAQLAGSVRDWGELGKESEASFITYLTEHTLRQVMRAAIGDADSLLYFPWDLSVPQDVEALQKLKKPPPPVLAKALKEVLKTLKAEQEKLFLKHLSDTS